MYTAVRNWVIRTMMKGQTGSGVVRTLPKQKIIEMNTQITAQRLMQNGINPEDLKNANQVENIINKLDEPRVIPADSTEGQGITEALLGKKKADVLDMEGNKLNPNEPIIAGTQVNQTTDINKIIADIKSLEPMDAMKEANLVIGRKNQYKNLSPEESKKILNDTEDHIFERDIPDEDFAKGGRAGYKLGSLFKFFNRKSPYQAGKDYLKSVKDRTLKANETGKFTDLPLETIPIGAGGGLITNSLKKKLQAMNEEQKELDLKEFIEELENDEFYQKNPELKDKTIADYTERLFRADGGRIGLKIGTGKKFLEFLKKFKVKQSGDDVKEFISKRQFMKDFVGNTEKNKKARDLQMLKEAMEKARAEGGFKFKDVDVDKDIRPIFDQSKDRTLNATGGRIGYKVGSVDKMRRLILKAMGAGTVGIGAAKSGIFSGFGKGATKQVAKEVAQQTAPIGGTPPPYFFKLAEKIKKMGTDTTPTSDRTLAKTLLSKDGQSEYILEESLTSGNTLIKKVYKEEDMITNVEIMSFTKGEDVVTKKGKAIKTADEYEEVTETNSRVYKDNFNDPDYEDGINVDEIIKEVDDTVPSIKYASGGLAYMLGE